MIIGFIGLGLIGGSIAKAIRATRPEEVLYAYDINQRAIEDAVREGVITKGLAVISKDFVECDIIFLCAPVLENDSNLEKLAAITDAHVILTDVGSVKTDIHQKIIRMGLQQSFIGGHPMAGSEKTGYENASAGLFENAYYMLTPTEDTADEKLEILKKLVQDIGAIPLVVNCGQHDYATAAISHLPHIIAASLVNLVQEEDKESGIMKTIAAGGFRDITRIASSSPQMWQSICMTNTENILKLLENYQAALSQIREEIAAQEKNKIYSFFERARDYRDSFTEDVDGPIRKVYALHVDIPDVPGSLAAVATLLAAQQISIKNIGIIHNREFEEGVLRIEFYDASAKADAQEMLPKLGYKVYLK